MRLRTAINEYKARRGSVYPEECATTDGAFSAHGDRLVHITPSGHLRDYSSSLSGLYGLDRSRLGIETDSGTRWFDEFQTVRQHYYRETNLVETEYDAGEFTVHQYDLTLGRAHATHIELRGSIPVNAELTAFLTFAPEGTESQVGRLIHNEGGPDGSKAVEIFHRTEHDYVTASTGISTVGGQIPERFDEIMSDEHFEFPRDAVLEKYEDTHLSGDVVVSAPLERSGRAVQTTLVTQLSDHTEVDRETALTDLRQCAIDHQTADEIRQSARDRAEIRIPESAPNATIVRQDLRSLSLLTAPTGVHIAGPEFDPFYAHSGGYGYTWFRDESETGRYLLTSNELLGLDIADELIATAQFLCETQSADGSWSHRAWAIDGSIAPGWAHGRLEGNKPDEYQADQTASAITFLADVLTAHEADISETTTDEIVRTIEAGVESLDETIADNGLPQRCQNLWENMSGQFTHTAATYLTAYATIADAAVPVSLQAHAESKAEDVFEAIDQLWSAEREAYGLRLDYGSLDNRLDSAGFALVDAFRAYDTVSEIDEKSIKKLCSHVKTLSEELYRDPNGPVEGLIRFEGDGWRKSGQSESKVWSVSTGWGATANALLGAFLDARGDDADAIFDRAGELYMLLLSEGPLTTNAGYLAEQVFDDGRHDSATPLGWSHALRLHTTAVLREYDALPTSAETPSGPGDQPHWTTGEKYGVGTVADHGEEEPSKVWFTLTEGALTELRFPRIDLMNIRTVDFLIVDADEDSDYTARTYNETRRDDENETVTRRVEPVETDALSFRHIIEEKGDGRGHEWKLVVEYAVDPNHDALLADVQFTAGNGSEYELYAIADTSLTNTGTADRGLTLGKAGGFHVAARDSSAYDADASSLLVDENGEPYSVAVAMTTPNRFDWATVGVAGSEHLTQLFSDGVQPAAQNRADNANVVLVGRFGVGDIDETLAIGFGENADTAAALGEAEGAIARSFETVRADYINTWRTWLDDKPLPDSVAGDAVLEPQYLSCLMALRAVEDKTFLGAGIASPSVPWGEVVDAEEERGYGYNFVWSRDLYQVFTVFEAIGDIKTAQDALEYIYNYQQDEEGFIPQNTYVNGTTRWGGEQMDNISFPQVMAYQLRERGVTFDDASYDFSNIKASADYVARNGPPTAQERWEEEAGYSPSSIAAEVAGLVCAADLAIEESKLADALIWLGLADEWTDRVEEWCATETGTELHTNTPYYVRVTRDGNPEAGHLRTLANAGPTLDEREIIDGGFLELTRLGIKSWDDQIIQNSLAEVDKTIRVDTPVGPAFYRYNGDGYGERAVGDEGAPWSVETKGKGRLWPIFSGERGEYELLAGTADGDLAPENLLETMAGFANSGRMLAEQVWDRGHSTDYNWEFGEGTGSATPLAWSMAQFIRLAHGVAAGTPVEMPRVVSDRYINKARPEGPSLRVESRIIDNRLQITGETDGDVIGVKANDDTTIETDCDGTFELFVPISHGDTTVTVAAATSKKLRDAGISVERFTI